MKIDRKTLQRALAFASLAAPARAAIPITSCVRLCASSGALMIEGTDAIVAAGITVECETGEEESLDVCVSAASFTKIVASLAGDTVEIKRKKEAIEVRCGSSKLSIVFQISADFPKVEWPIGKLEPIDSAAFSDAMSRATHAASNDESRAGMFGAILAGSTVAATDGHRAIIISESGANVGATSITVPPQLAKLVSKIDGPLGVTVWKDRLFFAAVDCSAFASHSLVRDAAPPVDRVVQRTPGATAITVSRDGFAAMVERIATCTPDSGMAVLSWSADVLKIKAEAPGVGQIEDEIEALATGGDRTDRRVGCCAKYLIQAARAADGSDITIDLSGDLDPIFVVGTKTIEAVMPMRVS
jgi:DNA polymerase III subunit beta